MSSHAPGPYLGYSLQITRFLMHLLEATQDSMISLEVFEDVGSESPDGRRIAEQSKSALVANPVANCSRDLWKTFSNWVRSAQSGELVPANTTFELYVSGNRTGEIVETFSRASSLSEARSAFVCARDIMWGSSPSFPIKSMVAKTIRPYVTNFFEADDELVSTIITNFRFESGSYSPQEDLKRKFTAMFVPNEILNNVLAHAQGWVKREIDLCLERSQPAIISVALFRSEMTSFVRKHDRRAILATFASDPSGEEVRRDIEYRTYVRQLDAIEADEDQKIRAVIDFLRASIDRTQWSAKGFVHETSFDEFESSLLRTWDNYKTRASIGLRASSDIERGKHLYAECSLHKAKLEGLEVPDHFTPGSFHALADDVRIGWHPDYLSILEVTDLDEESTDGKTEP